MHTGYKMSSDFRMEATRIWPDIELTETGFRNFEATQSRKSSTFITNFWRRDAY